MNSFRRTIKQTLQKTGDSARRLVDSTSNQLGSSVDRLLDRRVCLGVTGFSGSGKTTMITSLVHQLRYYPEAALAAFPLALQDRLLGVEVSNLPGSALFPYQAGIEALSSASPTWPEATRDESGCLLELKYRARTSLLTRGPKPVGRLLVEIRDYPGEWLLDLPLLGMSYTDWCRQCHVMYKDSGHKKLSKGYLERLEQLDPLAPTTESELKTLWLEQVRFLKDCREQGGLTMIQPGRLVHAESNGPESLAPFIPLTTLVSFNPDHLNDAPADSLFKICEKNYQHYLEQWVKPFYRNTFQKVDRQLVLIDVLRGLNNGPEALEDLRLALARVLQSFDYGRNSLLSRLINPSIDRVVFAASKIDQVLPDQHENVRSLTAALVREAQRRATFSEIDVRCEAVAAVRSTTTVEHQGQTSLKGMTDAGPGLVSHPAIPDRLPDASDWQRLSDWRLRHLRPPAGLQLSSGARLPHIRLDSVINDLLGDKCQ